MKILVCYDDTDRGNEAVEHAMRGGVGEEEVEKLFGTQLADEVKGLFKRVDDQIGSAIETTKLRFDDDWDLILIDDNLTRLEDMDSRLTAESVVDYLRAFTNIPYAISLNRMQFDFDLRFLMGDQETKADLALKDTHLKNGALWDRRKDALEGFLPWYWTELRDAPDRRRSQIEFLLTRLNEPALENLGMAGAFDSLSAHGKSFLRPDKAVEDEVELESVTFGDVFLGGGRSLLRAEREALHPKASGGDETAQRVVARTLAAQFDYWFRRDVVGPQDVLVDVPHLLARMPFLLGDRANDLDAWNQAIQAREAPFGMDSDLYRKHVVGAKFDDECNGRWLQLPVFHWPLLKKHEELNEMFMQGAQAGAWADAVFCEDTSRFEERSPEEDDESVVEFPTGLEGPWARRHISKIDSCTYSPQTLLAL